ncbi:hypothetical protein GUJ93_ZPchr0006g42590 [Zizania palustris]|uniref:Uncharacterized protein n=1 Tax=Zizania palustris TaxID=103762 RepID=A0A8J5SVZ7_ZIZPA|nr:hypothetical protein GUJ93_ZPchr0006g42590 [Zizania palustris]
MTAAGQSNEGQEIEDVADFLKREDQDFEEAMKESGKENSDEKEDNNDNEEPDIGTSEGCSEVGPPKVFGGGYLRRGFGGTSEATDRFVAGEPRSSGRLDARGAGSSVTVAAKGVRVGPRVEACQVKAESAERGSG